MHDLQADWLMFRAKRSMALLSARTCLRRGEAVVKVMGYIDSNSDRSQGSCPVFAASF